AWAERAGRRKLPANGDLENSRWKGHHSRGRRAHPNYFGLALLRGRAFEVGQVHAVDQLLEDGELFVLFFFLLGEDTRLVEHVLGDQDRTGHPDGERDRVARPRIDFHLLAVDRQEEAGKEDLVSERGDVDLLQSHLRALQDVGQQIMCDRSLRGDAGNLQRDRVGFVDADPDWEVAVGLLLFEDDHVLAAGHVHPDAVDLHLDEFGHARCDYLTIGFLA